MAVIESSFINKDGAQQKYYTANIMQDQGLCIGQLRIPKELADQLKSGKEYTLKAEYSETKYGNSLKLIAINGTNNTGKEC